MYFRSGIYFVKKVSMPRVRVGDFSIPTKELLRQEKRLEVLNGLLYRKIKSYVANIHKLTFLGNYSPRTSLNL